MVRPEQLQLRTVRSGENHSDGCVGVVADIEYGGHACRIDVRLRENGTGGDGNRTIVARSSTVGLPAIGDIVQVRVTGAAHAFAAVM
jgi:hypothetical protein